MLAALIAVLSKLSLKTKPRRHWRCRSPRGEAVHFPTLVLELEPDTNPPTVLIAAPCID
jgi:hypothetical protein